MTIANIKFRNEYYMLNKSISMCYMNVVHGSMHWSNIRIKILGTRSMVINKNLWV